MDDQIREPVCSSLIAGDIKIYSGDTVLTYKQHKDNIRFFAAENAKYHRLFTPLQPSTFTVNGKFSNIAFNESEIIDMLTIEPGSNIIKIGCNFGELINSDPPEGSIKPPRVKSTRGRRPKERISTRKKQGSGKYFSSQITFELFNPVNKKIYKIKLFRNGRFQVPGVSDTSMSDLLGPINILTNSLREYFVDDNIRPIYLMSVMRNYKCKLEDSQLFVHLNRLEEILIAEKMSMKWKHSVVSILDYLFPQSSHKTDKIGHNRGIAEIQHNNEQYFGLIVKFNTTVPWKANKKTTIKILKSGKINFDGCNSELEAIELYEWLMGIYRKNLPYIVHDSELGTVDVSTSDGESIYDTDVGN